MTTTHPITTTTTTTTTRVSVIVGCKNRTEYLKRTLLTWLTHIEITQIIVVDWDSDQSVHKQLFEDLCLKNFPKFLQCVEVHRVEKKNKTTRLPWQLPSCMNFALQFVKEKQLLKLDCDYLLHPKFFQVHKLEHNSFFAGNYVVARSENENHLNGAFYGYTADILKVGGYNGYIKTYGYDDTDLYERLKTSGMERKNLNFDHIEHIPHENTKRTSETIDSVTDVELSIITNMFLVDRVKWTSVEHKKTVDLFTQKIKKQTLNSNHSLHVCDEDFMPTETFPIEKSMEEECRHLGKRCVLYERYGFPYQCTHYMSSSMLKRTYEQRKNPKFILGALNGLGNKWRSIASAAVVAAKFNSNFIIEWVPNEHCNAKMSSLFDISDLCVSDIPVNLQLLRHGHGNHEKEKKRDEFKSESDFKFQVNIEIVEKVKTDISLCVGSLAVNQYILEENKQIRKITFTDCNNKVIDIYCKSKLTSLDELILQDLQKKHYFYISTASLLYSSFTNWAEEQAWLQKHFILLPHLHSLFEKEAKRCIISQCIGVHSRRGQNTSVHSYEGYPGWDPQQIQTCKNARLMSHFSYFIREMRKIRLSNPTQPFYICADRNSSYLAFQKEFPDDSNIFFHSRTSFNRSGSELEAAVIDLKLLRGTKYLLASPWSTFSELILRLGTQWKVTGKEISVANRGVLQYKGSLAYNFGDSIQSLASMQYFGNDFDYFITRDLEKPKECDIEINEEKLLKIRSWNKLNLHDYQENKEELAKAENLELEQFLLPKMPNQNRVKIIWNGWYNLLYRFFSIVCIV